MRQRDVSIADKSRSGRQPRHTHGRSNGPARRPASASSDGTSEPSPPERIVSPLAAGSPAAAIANAGGQPGPCLNRPGFSDGSNSSADETMTKSVRHAPDVRERAVRMMVEYRHEHDARHAAISAIADKHGCAVETLRSGPRRATPGQGLGSAPRSIARGPCPEPMTPFTISARSRLRRSPTASNSTA